MKKNTRELLLNSAFETFYKEGFQGANINTILNQIGINKGSMYHFFKSKKALGLAVIKERIEKNLIEKYSEILENDESIRHLFDTFRQAPEILPYGCPLNKMSQEMVYIDEDFKKILSEVYNRFFKIIQTILEKENIHNASSITNQIIATYEGSLMIYHLNQNKLQFRDTISALEIQLSSRL